MKKSNKKYIYLIMLISYCICVIFFYKFSHTNTSVDNDFLSIDNILHEINHNDQDITLKNDLNTHIYDETHCTSLDTYLDHILLLNMRGYYTTYIYDYDFIEKYLSDHAEKNECIVTYPIDQDYKIIINHSEKKVYLVPILQKNILF